VKKVVGSAIVCLMMLLVVGFNKSFSINAYAVNDEHYLQIEEVTANEAAAYNAIVQDATSILAGDYKVSYCIRNNTGFAASGASFTFDPTIGSPLMKTSDGKPVSILGSATNNLMVLVSSNLGINRVGFSTLGLGANSTSDGIIVSFFFRLNSGYNSSDISSLVTDIEVVQWATKNGVNVQYTINETNYEQRMFICIVGDIDNNGTIDAYDAQLLANILYAQGGTNPSLSIYDVNGTYSWTDNLGVTHYYDKLYIVSAGNVNGDNYINYSDASDILQYYSDYILNGADLSTYTGVIGTMLPVYQTVAYTNMT